MSDPVFDLPPRMLNLPPERIGVDPERIKAALAEAEELPFVTALLVARGNHLVAEAYLDGGTDSGARDLRELSDFYAMLLLGTAINRGEVAYQAPLAEAISDWPRQGARGDVSLRALARQLSGLAFPATAQSPSSLMGLPVEDVDAPLYNPNNRVLVTHAVASATGRNPLDYAWDVIFRRLGISPRGWTPTDQPWMERVGITAKDTVRLLWVHANRGVLGDKHIASREWLNLAVRGKETFPSEAWRPDYPDQFGQGAFWRVHQDYGGFEVREFVDPSGQRALILPNISAVILVLTEATDDEDQRQVQVKAIDSLVSEQLLPAFANTLGWERRERERRAEEAEDVDHSRPPWERRR